MLKDKTQDTPTAALLDNGRPAVSYCPEDVMPPAGGLPDGPAAGGEEVRPLHDKGRTSVRRRLAQRGHGRHWPIYAALVCTLAALGASGWETRSFLLHDARFLLASSSSIQLQGEHVVTRPEVLHIFARDLGHSIFAVPLQARRKQVEAVPWVRRATVMRLWPDRLRIAIEERKPMAYARDGNTVRMVDADGVLLDIPRGTMPQASLPVVTGISSGDPASTRKARTYLYQQFMTALSAGGAQVTQSVSEVDVSDPEDIRAIIANGSSDVLVHFGDSDFLARYQSFAAHRAEWLQQYPQLSSVDMRDGRQVVLDMGPEDAPGGAGPQTAASPPAPGKKGAPARHGAKSSTSPLHAPANRKRKDRN